MEGAGRGISSMLRSIAMVVVVVVVVMMMIVGNAPVEGACPSTGQLTSACSQYVVGANPPVPPPQGACCSLLRSSSASCLCSSIPASARSLVSKKGLSNVQSSCKLSFSCPGF